MEKRDGINLLAVKKANRKLILNHVYRNGQMSRKGMTGALGLTPAAITLITNDLLAEGLLVESTATASSKRRGRREVMLHLNAERYTAVGVYIGTSRVHIICINLANAILFEEEYDTERFNRRSEDILNFIADTIETKLEEYNILKNCEILGVGVSVTGIVDSRAGVSVDSYRIWERDVPVVSTLEARMGVPVVLTNNICALAHGESFLSGYSWQEDMLFIKYGPGVGATYLAQSSFPSVLDYTGIELGHVIMEANGAPCICGNCGCLETIVSYNAIEHAIEGLLHEQISPYLYQAVHVEKKMLRMNLILEAYNQGDRLAEQIINRTVQALSIAIFNAMRLFAPKVVVLYGELFENEKFNASLRERLSICTGTERVVFSRYNLKLEGYGPATTIINYFFENGGF